jgi:hypothetical protein
MAELTILLHHLAVMRADRRVLMESKDNANTRLLEQLENLDPPENEVVNVNEVWLDGSD